MQMYSQDSFKVHGKILYGARSMSPSLGDGLRFRASELNLSGHIIPEGCPTTGSFVLGDVQSESDGSSPLWFGIQL